MQTASDHLKFIRSIFGSCHVANDGVNVAVRCPNCDDDKNNKKKFSINLETLQCHCWVCGIKGKNLSPILRKFFKKDDLIFYSRNFLGEKYEHERVEKIEVEVPKLPSKFILLADNFKRIDPDIKSCLSYLVKRGISERDMWYFKLGTCTSGRHRRRIIIPSFDSDGGLNYYSSRSIDSNKIKYINAKFDKREIIFNEINIDWSEELTVVEGPFDLIKCNDNATCILGSNMGERYLLFKKIAANMTPTLLALDSDMIQKSFKIAKLLSSYGCDVRIMELGGKLDVGEMTKSEFLEKKEYASLYDRKDYIRKKIRSLKSGSII